MDQFARGFIRRCIAAEKLPILYAISSRGKQQDSPEMLKPAEN
jgi:hypothetical protein